MLLVVAFYLKVKITLVKAGAVTSTDFQRYVTAADTDGDGIIDFEEWVEMMRHIYDKPLIIHRNSCTEMGPKEIKCMCCYYWYYYIVVTYYTMKKEE